jgi:thiol-disulfide isomerase/thioredoxin
MDLAVLRIKFLRKDYLMKLLLVLFFLLACAGLSTAQEQVSLEGQVVCCADCWAEADRTKVEYGTAENLLKAKSCVENGDPTLLAVREQDKFMLYELVPGRFRLPGKNWLEFVGKRVSVTGKIGQKKTNIFRVDSLKVLAPSLAEQEAGRVIGTEVNLTLKDLAGVEQSMASLKGRVVVLNFWATYCIPCKAEMPDLAAIQNEFAALGVQVIGASTDEPSDRNKVLQFVKETRINFPVWVGATTADMIRFGLGGALPGTIVIGKDGRVAKVISGVINQVDLKKELEKLTALPVAEQTDSTNRKVIAAKDPRGSEASSVPS